MDLRAADAATEMSLAALNDSTRICFTISFGTAGMAADTADTTVLIMSCIADASSKADWIGARTGRDAVAD